MALAIICGLVFYILRQRPHPQALVVDGGTRTPSMSRMSQVVPPQSDDGSTAYMPVTPTKIHVRFFLSPLFFSFCVHSKLVVGPERSYCIPQASQRADDHARLERERPRSAVLREPTREYVYQRADWGPRRKHAGQHADPARVPRPAYRIILTLVPLGRLRQLYCPFL